MQLYVEDISTRSHFNVIMRVILASIVYLVSSVHGSPAYQGVATGQPAQVPALVVTPGIVQGDSQPGSPAYPPAAQYPTYMPGNAASQTVPLPSSGGVPYGPTPQVLLPTTPYGNTVPQTAPGMAPGGVASASTLSIPAAGMLPYGSPVAPGVAVVPSPGLPGPAIGVIPPVSGKGQQPGIPPYSSSSWANNACKFYSLPCVAIDSCKRKLRLPLSGCDSTSVCCNKNDNMTWIDESVSSGAV
ncbi:formin-2-like [Rhipicephalus sanguineus]|uniref:formin-2-like n=1 Tax=Rhipicephalus sanguineus TaxID=34632 RepID=UPI0020C46451|nr:formin-2-like [Rhipicephalus sanguineus]